MEQRTINVYKLEELPEDVQEKIINHWRGDDQFMWSGEWRDSLEEFCRMFNIIAKNWHIDPQGPSHIDWNLDGDEDLAEMSGVRLWKFLHNSGAVLRIAEDCPFTGYIGDECLLKPVRKFLERPELHMTYEGLIGDCLESWQEGFQSDVEDWLSEDRIREDIKINDYDFTIHGELF